LLLIRRGLRGTGRFEPGDEYAQPELEAVVGIWPVMSGLWS
jgi:hypothetical protein